MKILEKLFLYLFPEYLNKSNLEQEKYLRSIISFKDGQLKSDMEEYKKLMHDADEYVDRILDLKKEISRLNKENDETIKECNDLRREVLELKKQIEQMIKNDADWIAKKIPVTKTEPVIKIRSQEGWHFINELPQHSIPECIVTDGEIVAVVQYDHNTKQFLKVFGAQALSVGKPVAWMPLPLPPAEHRGFLHDNRRSVSHLAQTYLR